MNICHLTSVHPWRDVRIFEKECVSLAAAGHTVTLVATDAEQGMHKGVQVINVPKSTGGRLQRMWNTVEAVAEAALAVDADIYHLHDPELLRIAKRLLKHNKLVVYDSHEDLPRQILDKNWLPAIVRKPLSALVERYEDGICSQLSGIVTATPFIRERFLKVNKQVTDINNFPIIDHFSSAPDWSRKLPEICYVGALFKTRGVTELVQALDHCDVTLNLAGQFFPESYAAEVQVLSGWKKVNYLGFIGREKVTEVLGRSSIGLVTLMPTRAYLDSLPVKMFEYMAAGIPVIASDFPYWKSIIDRYNCGICVDPKNPKAIAAAVTALLADPQRMRLMGENGREAVRNQCNWNNEAAKLIQFYTTIQSPAGH